MQIEIVNKKVNEIIPYWRNPRRNDKTVEALVDEIQKRGFNVPIVIDKNNVVVKGHARLKAAKRLGMEEVPCIVSDASEDVIKADRIADNKIQELSSWDFGKLDAEIDKLGDKMEFKKLFVPEDVVQQESEIPEYTGFTPVSLAGMDFSEDGEGFDFADVAPKGFAAGHEHQDVPMYVDVGQEQVEAPKAEPRKLKTLCPYCGKIVVVSL